MGVGVGGRVLVLDGWVGWLMDGSVGRHLRHLFQILNSERLGTTETLNE